jgi:hypothetical protein
MQATSYSVHTSANYFDAPIAINTPTSKYPIAIQTSDEDPKPFYTHLSHV